jgi:NAD(P)-dependent dehydrogenase (short-subunit alcohol dehydrogenase family)
MVNSVAQGTGAALLAGRRAIIATAGASIGAALVSGLRRHGARVVEIDAAFGSRAVADAALADAARELGGADLVVHACAEPAALASRSLDTMAVEDWNAAAHRGMLDSLYCLQGAYAQMRDVGGSVVTVGPSASLVGAPGLVALMTLSEGQRTLIKSAARQWGRHGMRLNWVGIAGRHYAPALAQAAWPQTPELGPPPPALGRVPELPTDVADVIAWLGSDGARGVTGASFNLDGGDWMVP